MEKLDETASVISASKVTGTEVYNTAGDHLGHIHDVMIDKRSGRITYAVMSFGGFLGIGERYHPLPWATLKYDTRQGGYVIGVTADELKQAPTYAATEMPRGEIAPTRLASTTTTSRRRTGAHSRRLPRQPGVCWQSRAMRA